MAYGDTAPQKIQDIAAQLENGEVWYAAGGIWAVYITRGDEAYALVTEADVDGELDLGVYDNDEDEGRILKTWAAGDTDGDVDIIRTAIDTYNGYPQS